MKTLKRFGITYIRELGAKALRIGRLELTYDSMFYGPSFKIGRDFLGTYIYLWRFGIEWSAK